MQETILEVPKKIMFNQFILEKYSAQSIKALFSFQSINKDKLTIIIIHNNLTRAINVVCVHQFHIWEVVCFLLAIDVLVHILVVEIVLLFLQDEVINILLIG